MDSATAPTWRWVPASAPARGAFDSALTVASVLGITCLIAAALAASAGVRPFIVRSGSMAPDIPVGALVLARAVPAADVSTGEVVSVVRADGNRVTHRVVDIAERTRSLRTLTLQGDANAAPDAEQPIVSQADRVFLAVPHLGTWLHHLGSTPSWFLAGLLTGVALLRSFGPPTVRQLGRWTMDGADTLLTGNTSSGVAS